jgi:ribosomal protein L37AE/L43A
MTHPSNTASGMVHVPELGEYCFTYVLHVDCPKCQKDATIGRLSDGVSTLFKCEHCGWSEQPQIKYRDLLLGIVARIEREIVRGS